MIYCPSKEKLVNEICKDSQGCEIVFESYEVFKFNNKWIYLTKNALLTFQMLHKVRGTFECSLGDHSW